MKMKKIQRGIKSITLTILMIGAVTGVSGKTFFPLFLTSDTLNPVYTQDKRHLDADGHTTGLSSFGLRFIDDKNLQFFYKGKDNPYNFRFVEIEIMSYDIKPITWLRYKSALSMPQDNPQIVDVGDGLGFMWRSFYSQIESSGQMQDVKLRVSYRDPTLNRYTFSFKDLNVDFNHLFPTNPDHENLRIEKKSDTAAEIFYAIDPNAPAAVPAGYNFDFTRLEAEYASAGNPDDVQSIELSFNAKRQAYSAVLDNLEAETDYVVNRLIWHYTLTDQSDSSKSYSLFSPLSLPPTSNSFNLNNLNTDVYVVAAHVEIQRLKTEYDALGGLAAAGTGTYNDPNTPAGVNTPTLSEAQNLHNELLAEIQRLKAIWLANEGSESTGTGTYDNPDTPDGANTPTLSEAQALVQLLKKSQSSHSPSSNNHTLIIGVSAGVGGALLLFGGLGYGFYRRHKS